MEPKWEKNIEARDSFIPSIEIAFGHREGMSQVESSVHVGVGKGFKVLGFLVWLCREILVTLPDGPGALFEGNQFVSPCGVLHRFN